MVDESRKRTSGDKGRQGMWLDRQALPRVIKGSTDLTRGAHKRIKQRFGTPSQVAG